MSPLLKRATTTRGKGKTAAGRPSGGHRKLPVETAPLSWGERLDILDALALVLEGAYAHLPLKRSLYGFDILRGLERLRLEVPIMTDLQFHRELIALMNRLRDAHTQYAGPWTIEDPVASLPFLVEGYGSTREPRYVVSKVDRRSVKDPAFVAGVSIEHWNGIPFDRAVELHAERETGGRPDSRRARALDSLTFRSLAYAPPPDEEWVVVGYRDLKGAPREIRLDWRGLDPGNSPLAGRSMASRRRRGINSGAEAVRRAKKFHFNHALWRAEKRLGAVPAGKGRIAAKYADVLSTKTVRTRHGRFGYLRIWSFDVDDDNGFLRAAMILLRDLPPQGLIIDLRNNPGGLILAAERLLQFFTPNPVVPTRFALRATALTAAMAHAPANQSELSPWCESLASALQTGEPYSSHIAITSPELCNDLGQQYSGPIVVVTDANTYSSGDLFTAGVLDNRIGPVVCVGEATGAGGANVWDSDDLRSALRGTSHPLAKLPDGVSFQMAIRRAVRSGDADGTLIEDSGVPGQAYAMTRDDIFEGNRDLIDYCAELLASQPKFRLDLRRTGTALVVSTMGLDRLDVFVDGHPIGASIFPGRDGNARAVVGKGAARIDVVGYADGVVRQRRRLITNKKG